MKTIYLSDRNDWRKWLEKHHEKEREIWLIYPRKDNGKARMLYNDAVEEALCFGWIDSNMATIDEQHSAQKFSPRNPKSGYSQANIERLRWLDEKNMLLPSIKISVSEILMNQFVFPPDIIQQLKENQKIWKIYQSFSDGYKRIRIAYIDSARNRPDEFEKRLNYFLEMTGKNKLIRGHGGIEKYY
ncbi:MAG: YdeI/OmpD-associated family protein [Saprospiraceae bacterium]|nr:YdeI/OmpD-associated family protein [Saprospiraceae bacterium]